MSSTTPNITLTLPEHGEFPNTWDAPLNANLIAIDLLFGAAGHSHDGSAGSGPQLDHSNLLNVGATSHADLDAHVGDIALHTNTDTKVSVVREEGGTDKLDVTTLEFRNATVTELSSGVVRIEPTIPDNAGDATAPVLWADSFSEATVSPRWYIDGAATAAGPGLVLSSTASSGLVARSRLATPHSAAQRSSLEVTSYTVDAADSLIISLDILSGKAFGSSVAPNALGISLTMSRAVSATTVNYALTIDPGAQGTLVTLTDFSAVDPVFGAQYPGGFQNLPEAFLVGTHELSLSVSSTGWFANYYYNGGLVFRQEITATSGDPTVAAFAAQIPVLLAKLKADGQPEYGRMGFGVGSSGAFSVSVAGAAVGATSDATTLGATEWPAPPAPPVVPVCATGEFTSYEVGDTFDFDGPDVGAPGAWTITGTFAAGEQGAQNGPGFFVTDGTTTEAVWCTPPTFQTATGTVNAADELDYVAITGLDMPTGVADIFGAPGAVHVEITHDAPYPENTVNPTGVDVPAGSPVTDVSVLGGDLVGVSGFGDAQGTSTYVLGIGSSSGLMKWGSTMSVKLTPAFPATTDFSVTAPAAITVVPRNPFSPPIGVIQPNVVEYWKAATQSWEPIPAGGVPEGSYLHLSVNAVDLPPGTGYWEAANATSLGTWSIADINDLAKNPGHVGPAYQLSDFGPQIVDSLFSGGVSPSLYGPTISGAPLGHSFAQPQDGGILSVLQMVVKLADDQWTTGAGVSLQVDNPLSGATWGTLALLAPSSIIPARPIFTGPAVIEDTPGGTVVPLTESTFVSVTFPTKFVDDDVVVTLGSGWLTPGDVPATDVSVSGGVVTIQPQELAPFTAATSVTITLTNAAAEAAFPGSGVITGNLGLLESSGSPVPGPPPVLGAGAIDVVQNVVSAHVVAATDVVDGAVLSFTPTGVEDPYLKFAVPPTFDGTNWNYSAYAIEPLPATLPATGTLYLTNPDGQQSTRTVNITADTVPTLTSVNVGSPTGSTVWDSSIGSVQTLFFTTANAGAAPTFTETSGVALASGNLIDLGAGVFSLEFTLANPVDSASLDFKVSKQVQPGNIEMADTLVGALTVLVPTSGGGNGSGGLSGGGTLGALTGNRTAQPDPVLSPEDSPVSFIRDPEEGHYTEFTASGTFYPVDSVGSNLTVDLVDPSGGVVSSSTNIVSATSKSVSGSMLVTGTRGTRLALRISDGTRSETVTIPVFREIVEPPRPVIRNIDLSPATPGAVGAILTVTGENLAPRTAPAGQPAIGYVYTTTASGSVFTAASQVSVSPTQVVYSVDIDATAAGRAFGLDINYLGGTTRYPNGGEILPPSVVTPQVTSVSITGTGTPPRVSVGGQANLTITGTGLGAENVRAIYWSVTGEAGAMETPAGPGVHPEFGALTKISSIASQSDTQLTARIPATPTLAGQRIRIYLDRAPTHSLGAGYWSSASIDATGLGTVDGVDHYGLTASYGTYRTPSINTTVASGTTQRSVAAALQTACGPGKEGTTFTLSVRLNEAILSSTAPVVVAPPDPVYGVSFENVTSSRVGSMFEMQIQADVPVPPSAYGSGTWGSPAVIIGLELADGTPIAAATLGAASPAPDPGAGI